MATINSSFDARNNDSGHAEASHEPIRGRERGQGRETSFGRADHEGYVTLKLGVVRVVVIALVAAIAVAGLVKLWMS